MELTTANALIAENISLQSLQIPESPIFPKIQEQRPKHGYNGKSLPKINVVNRNKKDFKHFVLIEIMQYIRKHDYVFGLRTFPS